MQAQNTSSWWAGPLYNGVRKLAFLVPDMGRKLSDMGHDAVITQPIRPGLIEGSEWRKTGFGKFYQKTKYLCRHLSG